MSLIPSVPHDQISVACENCRKSCSSKFAFCPDHFCCIFEFKTCLILLLPLLQISAFWLEWRYTWVICMNTDSTKWVRNRMRLHSRVFAECMSFFVSFLHEFHPMFDCLDVKVIHSVVQLEFWCLIGRV